jgi:hypothetical protein
MDGEGKRGEARAFPMETPERLALRAGPLEFSLAQSYEDVVQAYKLVYRNYLRAEYIEPHESGMRYSVFNILPETATVVAKLGKDVVTTASVIFDSPLGLPMDTIYKDEVDELRARDARVCEVTMLADRRRAGIRTIPSILKIFKLLLHHAHNRGRVTDILITINPSHEVFYTRYLPFDDFAGLRHYPSVNNAPALAKRQNLRTLFEEHKNHKLYEFFIDSSVPPEILETQHRFTEDELRDLFVVQRDILGRLPGFALDYVKDAYPEIDFDRVLSPVEK